MRGRASWPGLRLLAVLAVAVVLAVGCLQFANETRVIDCWVDTDCGETTDGECGNPACRLGKCVGYVPAGHPVAQQTAGQCRSVQCAGDGGTMIVEFPDGTTVWEELTDTKTGQASCTKTACIDGGVHVTRVVLDQSQPCVVEACDPMKGVYPTCSSVMDGTPCGDCAVCQCRDGGVCVSMCLAPQVCTGGLCQ